MEVSELENTNSNRLQDFEATESLYLMSEKTSESNQLPNEPHKLAKSKEIETKNEDFNIDELIDDNNNIILSIDQHKGLNEPTSSRKPGRYKKNDKTTNKYTIHEHIFKKLIKKHDISRFFSKKLRVLYDFKIVFILDDSGSMNERLEESPLNRTDYKATRWEELQEFMKISIEISSLVNEEGCDVYFLNRPMAKNIRKFDDLKRSFQNKPSGLTPITAILSKVLKNNMPNQLNDKKLLTIIVTDGEPTNTEGRVDIKGFKECLISRPSNVYTTILACTDEDNSMEYLNNWDKYIQRLDVVDDFRSERQEIIRSQGSYFHFTYGDYVVKSLIGSTDPSIDNLDENKFKCCRIL